MSENHSLLPRGDCNKDDESSYDELSDNSSCDSYYSDSDSTIAEWESFLDTSGYLLYIDCHPFVKQSLNTENEKKEGNFVKDKLRQSTRSKFLKLLRRRDSKRRSKRYRNQDSSQDSSSASKVTFQDHEHGQLKIVNIQVNHDGRTAFGRRSTLIENLLGISISSFPNSNRVMIAGFTSGVDNKNEKNIKIGDWLKMIQNIEVDINNINGILEQFANNEMLVLHLQRVAAVEVTNQPPTNELQHQSKFVYHLLNYEEKFGELLCNMPVGIVFINTNNLSESDVEFEDIVYAYPKPFKQNIVCRIRGLFITLNHLLNDVTKSKPQISSFLHKTSLTHVIYATYDHNLLLMMLPDSSTSKKEMKLVHSELLRIFEFTYETIEKCFENQCFHKQLDHFFSLFFQRMLCVGILYSEDNILQNNCPQFEDVLAGAPLMSLPNEVQMQIDDALTEMEASDYRDWNEEPLDCQRLFTILGSALYHRGYLLASHFMHEDLIDVHSYCRQHGFFHLLETETVRSLVHWREVFPSSSKKKLSANNPTKLTDERCYILVVGRGKDLLVVIMEAGGCTEPPEDNMGPDPFYVEEVEATLSHIQELGIQEFADCWIDKNAPTYFEELEMKNNQKTDFLAFGKSTLSNKSSSIKKPEVTSILKRRSSDQGQLSQSGSIFSIPDEEFSEDSTSQEGYSERSEMSDEPVVGRRVTRESKNVLGFEDGDSDIDDYREGSQLSGGSYDLSELRQALLTETESTQPVQLTSGDQNVLYHYVQYDGLEGVLLLPPNVENSCATFANILDNFRVSSQNIHKLFQNTLRFKNMNAQDMAKSLMNKTLIAIKEHGTLFECMHQSPNLKRPQKITYWVIGRLFYMPYPREMYVCYQDSIPQNLIDMAFRLGVN